MLDQRVRCRVLHGCSGQLISIVVTEIEPLWGRRQAWKVLRQRQNLTFAVIGVIELRNQRVRARLIFDFLEPLVLGIRKIIINRRTSVRISHTAEAIGNVHVSVTERTEFVRGRTDATEAVEGPSRSVRRAIDRAIRHTPELVVAKRDRVIGYWSIDAR